MSGAVLNPVTGFWGKLPSRGDFVGRGLPDPFRRKWDRWVATHLAGRQNWPDGGLRLRIAADTCEAVGLLLPSTDAAGRPYPLSLFLIADTLPGPNTLEAWCEAALGVGSETDPDRLLLALGALPLPEAQDVAAAPALIFWRRGGEALAASPDKPGVALDRIFSSG